MLKIICYYYWKKNQISQIVPESKKVGEPVNKNEKWLRIARLLLIIGFGLIGSIYLLAAFFMFAEIIEELSVRENETVIISSVLFIFTILWFVLLAQTFKKFERLIIRIMVVGLLFFPVL